MARMTGAVGRIGALYFAIIAFVAVLLLVWPNSADEYRSWPPPV
jgi:hypothetical protein